MTHNRHLRQQKTGPTIDEALEAIREKIVERQVLGRQCTSTFEVTVNEFGQIDHVDFVPFIPPKPKKERIA